MWKVSLVSVTVLVLIGLAKGSCPNNEELIECPSSCPPRTCATKDALFKCAAPLPVGDPKCPAPACQCKEGFYRNDLGNCVTKTQCDENVCPKNQVYDLCPASCPPRTCATKDVQFRCVTPLEVGDPKCPRPKCRCADGFYSNDNGDCVTKEQCNENVCPKNQVYDLCPSSCPPRTCLTRDIEFDCVPPLEVGDPKCPTPTCRCADGFYSNDNGDCVTKEQCTECPGPNEYFSCGGACDNVCATLSIQNQTSCPIINIRCNEMCYCNEGYARNSENICVPFDQCKSKTCKRSVSDPASSECSTQNVDAGRNNFNRGNSQFTANFYSELSEEQPGTSTISSPYSLLFLLAQLALYTEGPSYDQLISALGLQDKEQIRCTFPALLNAITAAQSDVTFDLATKVYSNEDYPLSSSFISDSRDVFRSQGETLDFSQAALAAQTINQWVASNTNNKITDLISADALGVLTRIVLVNAIYFKGKWQQPFNETLTQERPFSLLSGESKGVPTMTQKGRFLYAESQALDCKILSMPYEDTQFSFVIYLPNQVNGLSALQTKMQDVTVVENALNSATNASVTVFIPKFSTSTTIDLNTLLKNIGISQIFDQDNSGITGMLATEESVYVSNAIQKAFIEITEEGTEAAAANALVVGTTSFMEPLIFKADRPFAYQLRFDNSIVFTGSYYGD